MDKVDEGLMISLGASHTPSGNGQVPRFTCSWFVFKGQEVCFRRLLTSIVWVLPKKSVEMSLLIISVLFLVAR